MMKSRAGFTIVEILAVIAILAVLMGLVGTAAAKAVKNARVKRTAAMKQAWNGALTTYYAQKGKWPDALEARAKTSSKAHELLTDDEANSVFQAIVNEALNKNNSLIDVSALYVCLDSKAPGCNDLHGGADNCKYCKKSHYCGSRKCPAGLDFTRARAMNKDVSTMAFGYPGQEYGKFRRFYIRYNGETDSVKVGTHYSPQKECSYDDVD